MKRMEIVILFLFFMMFNLYAQIPDDEILSGFNHEYSKLYNELFEIVKNEFQKPIVGELTFIYDELRGYGYGLHISPFTKKIHFSNSSYLQCNENTPIFSMTSGIIKNIIYDRMIIIEYNGIEIFYRDLNISNIDIGDDVIAGQLLGTRKGADALHNYFDGIIIKIKYKKLYFNLGFIFDLIKNCNQE